MRQLVVIAGRTAPESLRLESRAEVLLGRAREADLRILDETASRRHARILEREGRTVLEDLGSANGILLNGKTVQVGEIDDGDRMVIGGHEFQLVVEVREAEPDTYELPPV